MATPPVPGKTQKYMQYTANGVSTNLAHQMQRSLHHLNLSPISAPQEPFGTERQSLEGDRVNDLYRIQVDQSDLLLDDIK